MSDILQKFYENDRLKAEFIERTDKELIEHFKNGLMVQWQSSDIVLRETEQLTILDKMRQEVVWA